MSRRKANDFKIPTSEDFVVLLTFNRPSLWWQKCSWGQHQINVTTSLKSLDMSQLPRSFIDPRFGDISPLPIDKTTCPACSARAWILHPQRNLHCPCPQIRPPCWRHRSWSRPQSAAVPPVCRVRLAARRPLRSRGLWTDDLCRITPGQGRGRSVLGRVGMDTGSGWVWDLWEVCVV